MAGIREKLDLHFRLAMDDPMELVRSLPNEAELFGAEKLIYNYRNPASKDVIRDFSDTLRLVWREIAEATGNDRMTASGVHNFISNARTATEEFKVTGDSMRDFAKFGPEPGMKNYLGVLATEITGEDNLLMVGNCSGGLPVVALERAREEVIAGPIPPNGLPFKVEVGENVGYRLAYVPASDTDIQSAMELLEEASPRNNSGLYPVQRAA